MSVALVQLVLCLAAGYALWRLMQLFDREERSVRFLVIGGFLARAVGGVLLFWISFLALPIARSLQAGKGLWFFANDAMLYFPNAVGIAHDGIRAIINYPRNEAAVTYVQALGTFVMLFGDIMSVAVLLNLFCYLGTCLLICRWRHTGTDARLAGLIALAAVCLSPSAMLWSMQPLKDTLFQLLIVAYIGVSAIWQRAWRERPSPAVITASGAAMLALLFAVGGVRWYFAFVLLLASVAFLLLTAALARNRRLPAIAVSLLLFALMTQAFVYGGGAYVPAEIQVAFKPAMWAGGNLADVPSEVFGEVGEARQKFEATGGRTTISVGESLRPDDENRPGNPLGVALPASPAARLAAGVLAVIVPRTILRGLHLVRIESGYDLWWFIDIDTVVFDVILIAAAIFVVRRLRGTTLRNPLFWLTLSIAVGVGVPIVYAVSNFGTLFRLRLMVYTVAALIPLALSMAAENKRRPAD